MGKHMRTLRGQKDGHEESKHGETLTGWNTKMLGKRRTKNEVADGKQVHECDEQENDGAIRRKEDSGRGERMIGEEEGQDWDEQEVMMLGWDGMMKKKKKRKSGRADGRRGF